MVVQQHIFYTHWSEPYLKSCKFKLKTEFNFIATSSFRSIDNWPLKFVNIILELVRSSIAKAFQPILICYRMYSSPITLTSLPNCRQMLGKHFISSNVTRRSAAIRYAAMLSEQLNNVVCYLLSVADSIYRFSVDSSFNLFKALRNVNLPGSGHEDDRCYVLR